MKIGEIFGGRDHTTALHGIKKVEADMRARDATLPPGPGPHPGHPQPGSERGVKTVGNILPVGAPIHASGPSEKERHVFPTHYPQPWTVGEGRYPAEIG